MNVSLPANLAPALSEREAISDAIYRVVLAFDLADESLLLSAVTEDISAEMATLSTKGVPELKAAVFDRVSKLDTTHFISNMRVTIEHATAAKLTCSAMAQHVRPGKGLHPGSAKFTSGALYLCEMVKIGDLWKIRSWKATIVWVDGDPTVMAGE